MHSAARQITDHCREGLAYLEAGELGQARAHFSEIIAVQPDFVPALHALGMIARQERRADAALNFASRALAGAPHSAPAQVLMARTLCDLGRFPEASRFYCDALAQDDANPQTRFEFGKVAERLGDEQEALTQYRASLALRPNSVEARRHLTNLLRRIGCLPEAEQICQQRLLVAPDDAEAWLDLGNTLYAGEQYDHAATAFREALKYQPNHESALENLGNTLSELGSLDAAEVCLRRAVEANEALPGPHNGLGAVLRQRGDIVGAEACFRTALALAPKHVEATCNLATTLLLTGRMEEGWRLYEARWGTAKMPNRGFHQPLWNGEPLGGRTLLLHAEQGFGDALQFCRFIPRVANAKLILEVPAPLMRLMRLSFPDVAEFVVRGQALPEFDLPPLSGRFPQ
jgi:tetratricopeptide (TPR) repeat protein